MRRLNPFVLPMQSAFVSEPVQQAPKKPRLQVQDTFFVLPSREVSPETYQSHIGATLRLAISELRAKHKQLVTNKKLPTRLEASTDRLREVKNSNGDHRLARVRFYLKNMGITRSEDQCRFHQAFIHACLPQIYKDDWMLNSERVLREEKVKQLYSEVLIMTPRRWGKTFSVACYVLAMMLGNPGIRIAIFSINARASRNLTEIVTRFLNTMPNEASRVVKKNQEQLYLAAHPVDRLNPNRFGVNEDAPDVSKLLSLPASVTGRFSFQFLIF